MSDNADALLEAIVADPGGRVPPVSRPREVSLAALLLWLAIGLGVVDALVNTPPAPVGTLAVWGALYVLWLGLSVWVTHKISRGRNWARVAFLIYFLIGVPGFVSQLLAMFERPFFATAPDIAITVLQVIALYLVFAGAGAHWFSRSKGSLEPVA